MASVNSADNVNASDSLLTRSTQDAVLKRRVRRVSPEAPSLRERLAEADLFPKAVEESETSSRTSVVLSVLTLLFAQTLIIHQFMQWGVVHRSERIVVDTTPNERLNMFFNVTFPRLQCSVCNIDVMDVSGEFSGSYHHGVVRQRLSKSGEAMGSPVRDAEPLLDLFGEGCRLEVSVNVTKVAGNVHIAVGGLPTPTEDTDGIYRTRKHVHKFKMREMKNYDARHILHDISFGTRFPGQLQPLRDFRGEIAHVATYQYQFKVVPTTFTAVNGTTLLTNQYSYQKSFNYIDFDRPAAGSIPGLFFIYEFSPYRVAVEEHAQSMGQLLISLCAIVGGSLAVITMLYTLVRSCADNVRACQHREEAQGYASVSMQDIVK